MQNVADVIINLNMSFTTDSLYFVNETIQQFFTANNITSEELAQFIEQNTIKYGVVKELSDDWLTYRFRRHTSFDKYAQNIGKKVCKNRKPFKSGLKVNTIKGLTWHKTAQVPAYVFEEDDSYVNCIICSIVEQ